VAKNRRYTGRRAFLLGLGASAATGACAISNSSQQSNNKVQVTADEKRDFTVSGDTPLRDRAAAKNIIYGAATGYQILSSDSAFADSFARECAILVPPNALKFRDIRPTPTRFDFTEGDALLEFARKHKMLFRGHTLVWNQDFSNFGSEWLRNTINRQNAEQLLTTHVAKVAGHYAGKVHSWDVVNESVSPEHGRSDGLTKSPWLEFLGVEHIDLAFHTARQADSQALLCLNEVVGGGEKDSSRRDAILTLLDRLLSRGTPVQALGIESHIGEVPSNADLKRFRVFLKDVASLGLKILISEMDVIDRNLPSDIPVRDRIIAGIYEDYLSVVVEEPAVIAVLTWGLSDRDTWHSTWNPRPDKAPVRPLPLDTQLKRKLAWNAIARVFDRMPKRKI
jgi:endo-1,4-beta-xylanase